MKETNDNKKLIGLQVSSTLYEELEDLASELGGSISSTIRMILLDYLKRYKKYDTEKKGNKE